MRFRFRRLFALLLACLIGFVPIQAAFASGMPVKASAMAGMQHDHHAPDRNPAANKCDRCQQGDCCGGSHCVAGHCAVCVANALMPALVSADHVPDRAYAGFLSTRLPCPACYGFFRPPRA